MVQQYTVPHYMCVRPIHDVVTRHRTPGVTLESHKAPVSTVEMTTPESYDEEYELEEVGRRGRRRL